MFSVLRFLFWVVTLDLFLWGLAVSLGETPASYMGEGKFITWLSAAQLIATGLLLGWVYWQKKPKPWSLKTPSAIWLIMAVGFVFLALDDLTQAHENMDKWIHLALGMKETNWTDRLDDLIITIYGLIGFGFFIRFREELWGYRSLWPYLAMGVGLFIFNTGFDATINRQDILPSLFPGIVFQEIHWKWFNAFEELTKILAEAGLLTTAYACLLQVRQELRKVATQTVPLPAASVASQVPQATRR